VERRVNQHVADIIWGEDQSTKGKKRGKSRVPLRWVYKTRDNTTREEEEREKIKVKGKTVSLL